MSLRPWCFAPMLALGIALSGCSPTAESRLDEQQNPHFKAGKDKLSALDYKGAIESFERAVEDNPRSALAHFELGVLFEQHAGDYPAALYHYNKALKLRPNDYPAENIRQRIPACRQELLKADSLAIMNPTALRETENLRQENLALRKQVESLQAHLATRSSAGPSAGQVAYAREPGTLSPSGGAIAGSNSFSTGGPAGATGNNSPGALDRARAVSSGSARGRTHTVKVGETPYAISRQYRVKLEALVAANPGLDPKRIRIGQVLNIPAY